MPIIITRPASDNARNRRRAKRAAEYEKKRTVTGCRDRVARAISGPTLRCKQIDSGAQCLPDVALYAAGYRKSNSVTAR